MMEMGRFPENQRGGIEGEGMLDWQKQQLFTTGIFVL